MAAISVSKATGAVTLTQNAATSMGDMEMANTKSIAVQFVKTGAGKGAAKLQWTNDPSGAWVDVNSTIYPGAAASVGAGAQTISLMAEQISGAIVRALFTEDNTGAAAITSGKWIAKLY